MNQVTKLENDKKQLKNEIEFKDAILRLERNRDFKRVFLDGFLEEDCARYVRESVAADEHGVNEGSRMRALAMAQAAGYLKQYLSVKIRMGVVAESSVTRIDEELESAMGEE